MRQRIWCFAVSVLLTQSAFASDVTDNRATVHVFPQFADGRASDGSYYRSTILIATDTTPANCNIALVGMTYPGFGPNGSGGGLSITASSGWFLKTAGTQPLRSGAVALVCDQPVTAQVLFAYYSNSGSLISEATVFSSPPATTSQFWIDGDGGSRLAIALANGSTVTKTYVVAAFDGSAPFEGSSAGYRTSGYGFSDSAFCTRHPAAACQFFRIYSGLYSRFGLAGCLCHRSEIHRRSIHDNTGVGPNSEAIERYISTANITAELRHCQMLNHRMSTPHMQSSDRLSAVRRDSERSRRSSAAGMS